MKQGTYFATIAAVLLGTVVLAPTLEARTCSGNGDVIGAYGFVGSRDSFFLLGATAPGTNTSTVGPVIPVGTTPPGTTGAAGSNTPIGKLVSGLGSRSAFTAVGRIFLDGSGNIYSSPSSSNTTNTLSGSYTVNTDCTIKMTLNDAFSTGTTTTTGLGASVTTTPSVSLQGVIVDNSNEIDTVETGSTPAGAVVTFRKTAQFNACNNSTLSGTFGVVAAGLALPTTATSTTGTTGATGSTGSTTTTTTTPNAAFMPGVAGTLGTPFNLLGVTSANGSGMFVSSSPTATPPLPIELTGTYTVNVDCTGTATLTDANSTTRAISFVLVNEQTASTTPTISAVPTTVSQELLFVFSDPGVIGTGTAKQQ